MILVYCKIPEIDPDKVTNCNINPGVLSGRCSFGYKENILKFNADIERMSANHGRLSGRIVDSGVVKILHFPLFAKFLHVSPGNPATDYRLRIKRLHEFKK